MSFFDDASLAFLPSGAAGKDGKAYSIKPVPVYGSELVTNGDFATDSDWTKGSGWTISGGKLVGANANTSTYQGVGIQVNKSYKIEFSVVDYISGSVRPLLNGLTNVDGTNVSANGTYTQYLNSISTSNGNFTIKGVNFVGSIDNVSVKEVLVNGDFDFSRGSNLAATRIGADGLIEKGRENLLLQSNNFGTTWQTINASVTSGQSGYDGSSDAWLLTSTGGPLYQSISESGVVTFSVYAKANSGAGFLLRVDQTTQTKLEFNISTGAFISGSNYIDYDSISIGNGWYRLSVTFLAASTTTAQFRITDGSGTNISGSAYIQSAQLEIGLAATDVIESGATTGKAGLLEDEPRFDYSGGATCPSLLLEPSRTNLIQQSEYFGGSYWTIGNASFVGGNNSPEGLSNAYEFVENASDNAHFFYDNPFVIVNATSYTMSLFVKYNGRQWFRLWGQFGNSNKQAYFDVQNGVTGSKDAGVVSDIEDYGNGWYRIYATATSDGTGGRYRGYLAITDGDSNYQGDGTSGVYLYGAQFEAGSYPTSYIPNHSGGSVTRGGDVCNSAGDSSTFNDSEGVLYAEISALANDGVNRVITIVNSSTTINRVRLYYTTVDNRVIAEIRNASGGFLMIYNGLSNATTFNKFAVKYKNNDSALWVNGTEVLTNTSGGVPVGLNSLNFDDGSGSDDFYGKTKQILTFKTALSDSELATLTTI